MSTNGASSVPAIAPAVLLRTAHRSYAPRSLSRPGHACERRQRAAHRYGGQADEQERKQPRHGAGGPFERRKKRRRVRQGDCRRNAQRRDAHFEPRVQPCRLCRAFDETSEQPGADSQAGEEGGDDEDDDLERSRVLAEAGEATFVLADGLQRPPER